MGELKQRMSEGRVSADEIAEAFKTATSEGGQFYNGMEEASKTFSGVMSTLVGNTNALIGEVFAPISESILTDLLPSAIGYIEQLSTIFKDRGVDGLVEAVGEILSLIITKIADSAPDIIEMAVSVIQSFVDGLNDNVDKIGGSAAKIITSLVEGIISLLPSIAALGLNLLLSLADGLGDSLPTLIPTIIKTVIAIATYLINNLDKIYAAATKLMNGLIKGILASIPLVVAAIPKIIAGMVKSFGLQIKFLIDIGKNLIEGIWKGINNAREWLREKISGFFGGVVDDIKDFFGIHSPSTLMAEIGMYLDQGMAKGIWENIGDVDISIDELKKAVVDGYDGILKDAESKIKQLQGKMDKYSEGLSPEKLFEKFEIGEDGEEGIRLVDLESEIEDLEDFKENLNALNNLNIAPEFIDQIKQLGGEQGNEFAELLLSLPAEERNKFINDYRKLGELANETTEKLYKTEGENIKKSFYDSIDAIAPGMFSKGKTAGEEFYQGFIDAVSGIQASVQNVIPSQITAQGNQASLGEITGAVNELSKNMKTTHVTEKVYTLNGSELMRTISTLAKGGERLNGRGLVT